MTSSIWEPLPSVLSRSNNKPISLVWNDALRDHGHQAIGGAAIRRREIHLHPRLRRHPAERSRILTHELFHFAWARLGNPSRADWKFLLETELAAGARGELGWSSQWRKELLPKGFTDYACESFCDTAAWLFSACPEDHPEYTLAHRWRIRRRVWFLARLPFAW